MSRGETNRVAAHDGRQHFQEQLAGIYRDLYHAHHRDDDKAFHKTIEFAKAVTNHFYKPDEREAIQQAQREYSSVLADYVALCKDRPRPSVLKRRARKLVELNNQRADLLELLTDCLHNHKLLLPQWDEGEDFYDEADALREAGL